MSNRLTNLIAICFLAFLFLLAVFSMKDDSVTMDEVAHLPAGYSYLTQKDMRLNPEHPPLMKDLAAIPLLFIKDIKFPSEIKDWKEDINGQWGFGYNFLYHSGNPADKMIFWARIPMILILILLGYYIFRWAKELFGNKTALLSLFLFSFSPTFLTHGRLVTTDVGAAAGVFIATYYFLRFLKNSSKKNLILAGIFFGLAELAKFSLILLFPFFAITFFFWVISKSSDLKTFLKIGSRYLLSLILIFIIGYVLIWGVYQYHTWNYPPERQVRDTQFILSSFGSKTLANTVVWMADKPILRPAAQYLLGLFMVLQRASGGNTTYFLGEISAAGWKNYFPVVYSIKEPLSFHILSIIALLYIAWLIKKPFWKKPIQRIRIWLTVHFSEFAMLVFMVIYWATSISSNLNIGVRHLLPIFPFTILLVSNVTISWLNPVRDSAGKEKAQSKQTPLEVNGTEEKPRKNKPLTGQISNGVKSPLLKIKKAFLSLLLIWQATNVLAVYPSFLSYFNELAGGPENGYIYTVDSNLDWGQDLKRLTKWVEENKIEKIYIDYFGGGETRYYLKEKYAPWWGTRNPEELSKGSYLAVSATLLQGGRGEPVLGFNSPTGYYRWLAQYQPIAKIGYSIFVYYIDPPPFEY